MSSSQIINDLRGELCIVNQVLQRVATAELVKQTGQVADNGGRIWRIDVPWHIPYLHQWQVPIRVRSLAGGDLQTNHFSVSNTITAIIFILVVGLGQNEGR